MGDQMRSAVFGKNNFFEKIFTSFSHHKSRIRKKFCRCAALLRDEMRNTGVEVEEYKDDADERTECGWVRRVDGSAEAGDGAPGRG
jgi:hypothetical protein